MTRSPAPLILAAMLLGAGTVARADWPTLRGNPRHDGFVAADPQPPYRLAWARTFDQERLGTAMEPVAAGGRVYVATHGGRLFALEADTGNALWKFQAQGPFLHSPALAEGKVVAGSVDGRLYALDATSGTLLWHSDEFPGGFSASPVIEGGRIYLGSRGGDFLSFRLSDGTLRWRRPLGVPIRQTAAVLDERVWVTAEDLRVRCFGEDGALVWTSESLNGQTARDYYPVVVKAAGRAYVVVRTNPSINMAQRIGRDRQMLARQAGVDDSDWRKLDAWIKSDAARGNPDLWASEQDAIRRHLEDDPEARTFFVFDADTGREVTGQPVLWAAGCQGVGTPPVLTADGRLLVFFRSAYGNWSLGVAPLVALGRLDLARRQIDPLFHQAGSPPPWNTFWGTADESQNFVVAGHTALIVHQGTLSGFDLESGRLFPIEGKRDTFGGFRAPAWAWNEWHGPARGGVALDGDRVFWLTGSRLLCLRSGSGPGEGVDQTIDPGLVKGESAPKLAPVSTAAISERLDEAVRELLSRHWAPLRIEPGLAGSEIMFDNNGMVFEALAWAYPFLKADLQIQVRRYLAEEWENFPPYTAASQGPPDRGARREWRPPPAPALPRTTAAPPPHPFGNLPAIALYAVRCEETSYVRQAWPALRACFEDFERTGWRLEATGDVYGNRYLAALLAVTDLAKAAGDNETAGRAAALADRTTETLIGWWQRAATEATFREFNGPAELDPFINRGSALSLRLAPHRHKLALFQDLSPTVAQRVKAGAGDAVGQVWTWFEALYRTWPLQGEEGQVHYGENYLDPPDLALGAFAALNWLQDATPGRLARQVDIPCCRADLTRIIKLALVLERATR